MADHNEATGPEAEGLREVLLPDGDHDFASRTVVNDGSETQGGSQLDESVPEKLGKYELRQKLGAGAMGAVYLGYDPMIDREVAIKLLPGTVSQDPVALQRFLGEARAAGQLSHPNTIAVFDIGDDAGVHYIVMELAGGGSLADRLISQERLPFEEACRVTIQAARGLSAAHEAGLIHRDIKPENLMLAADGTVKIVDFGLSKLLISEAETQAALTGAGQVLGTPHYMSPEQFEAGELDARSDLYSLGATFFRLLSGEFPFGSKSIHQIMYSHLESPPPDPRKFDPDLPTGCTDIVAKAMAKSPDDRYPNMQDFIAAIERLVEEQGGPPQGEQESPAESETGTAPSVLIVEPSKLQARIVKDAFEQAGAASVDVVGSADAALQFLSRSTPDTIIAARHLPDTEGDAFYRQIESRTGLDRSLFVSVSASDDATAISEVRTEGPTVRVEKQAGVEDVFRAIHASTSFCLSGGDWTSLTEARDVRLLVVTADGTIPPALGQVIRSVGVLDISVTGFDQSAAGRLPNGKFNLVLALVSSGHLKGEMLRQFSEQAGWSGSGRAVVFGAVDMDGDAMILRYLSRDTLQLQCRCTLDENRLTRLVEIV